ncbi:MAG: NAD-dependent epimerase/dehydratase family protein [Hymenobacter sp.]|nr:NAD-dependent epimerase/dehydratase family protein [Hymenobacter sp.]
MKIRAILTGATGMVGEGVLLECLLDPDVEHILLLSRRPSGVAHPKVRELLHADLQDLSAIENQLTGYNACFFCAGISSVGITKGQYEHVTYDLTLHVAETLARRNPTLTFTYVSGAGTDSRGQSRFHWARVKGRTENALLALPFVRAYMFRPGYLHPTPGQHYALKMYQFLGFLYPLLRRLAPARISTLRELGQAMLAAVRVGYPKPVLEVLDIVALAARAAGPVPA